MTISIILHALLLLIGVVWIVAVIPPPPEKVVDFMPSGGGGGSPNAAPSQSQRQQTNRVMSNAARVAAAGVTSDFTLPEPDLQSTMSEMGALGAGSLSGGLGGSGSGGGRGSGHGTGFGDGMGPGKGMGSGLQNPFGMINPNQAALVGTFYDLKQSSRRRPTEMSDDGMREEMRDIIRRGFKDRHFNKYFTAPQKLQQTKIFLPMIDANLAPAAFNCEKEVEPRRWVVVYRGVVEAPKTGKFRFVGVGDDLLAIRFNNQLVFDYGYTLGTSGSHIYQRTGELNGSGDGKQLAREMKSNNSPMSHPVQYYRYPNMPLVNEHVGGLAIGPEFEASAGKTYPIEILIGEIPGGRFAAYLLIEEIGVEYQKDAAGTPILPLFRLDQSVPDTKAGPEIPPFDPNGPVWKPVRDGGKLDI